MSPPTTGSIQSFYSNITYKGNPSFILSIFQDKYQLVWFVSHLVTLSSFFMYSAWIFNPEKKYLAIIPWYKLTNYCCILTYSIVIYKRYLCDENINKNEFESNTLISYILKTENVQLIISAFLWTVTEESFFKLVPFAIYATLNLSCFLVFEAYPQTQFSISLAPFISFIKNPCLIFSAFIDIFIIGLLFHESFKKNSYYVFFLYSFIWCLKMDNSEASRIALFKILKVVDIIFRNQMVPKKINQSWLCFRMKILRLLSISNSGNFIDSTNRPDFYSDGTEGKVEQIVS